MDSRKTRCIFCTVTFMTGSSCARILGSFVLHVISATFNCSKSPRRCAYTFYLYNLFYLEYVFSFTTTKKKKRKQNFNRKVQHVRSYSIQQIFYKNLQFPFCLIIWNNLMRRAEDSQTLRRMLIHKYTLRIDQNKEE